MIEFFERKPVQGVIAGAFLVNGLLSGAEAIDRDRHLVAVELLDESDLESRGVDMDPVAFDEAKSATKNRRDVMLGSTALSLFASGFLAASALHAPNRGREEQEPQFQNHTNK